MLLAAIELLFVVSPLLGGNSEVSSACQYPGCHCTELLHNTTVATTSISSTHVQVRLDCQWMPSSELGLQSKNLSISIVNTYIQCRADGDAGILLAAIHEQTAHLRVLTIEDCMMSQKLFSQVERYPELETLSLRNATIEPTDTDKVLTPLSNTSFETSSKPTPHFSMCSLTQLKRFLVSSVSKISFDACQDNDSLSELAYTDISHTYLTHIPDIFANATHLFELILHNNNISSISKTVLYNLVDIRSLDLSSNKLTSLPEGAFSRQINLQHLNLSNNQMTSVPAKLLLHNHNLTYLDLSHNDIKFLSSQLFASLRLLSILNISHNSISFVVRSQFASLSNLRYLHLGHNNLRNIPHITSCRKLKLLDFRHNSIKYSLPSHFKGLSRLEGISLKHNLLETLVLQHLAVSSNLQVLDVSQNKISHLDYSSKVTIRDGSAVNNSLSKLKFVMFLVLQSNLLTDIYRLGGTFTGLRMLNLNNNHIKSLFSQDLPRSLEVLGLSYNRISTIEYNIFTHFPHLTYINLELNYPHLTSMPALVAMTYPNSYPQLYLSGNLFTCDCRMAYLKTYANGNYSRSFRYYSKRLPQFADLGDLKCITEMDSSVQKLVDVPEANFLCVDDGVVCELACGCCSRDENNTCGCAYMCPESCRCYQGGSPFGEYDYRVYCNKSRVRSVPTGIPPCTTYLHLDRSVINEVSIHDLANLGKLKFLFLNNTGLSTISAASFKDLGTLKALHLENNKLSTIVSGTWQGLDELTHLRLQNNLLQELLPGVFLDLPRLQYLDLRDNLLTRLMVNVLPVPSPRLGTLLVSKNPLSCSCPDMVHTTAFMAVFGYCLSNLEKLYCTVQGNNTQVKNDSLNATTEFPNEAIYLQYFDIDICKKNKNNVNETRIQSYLFVKDNRYISSLSVFSIILVLAIISSLIVFRKRDVIQAWVFVKFGVRVRSPNAALDETGRTYDAFVSYSSLDETLVVRELAPKLEAGDGKGGPRYKLCLHYRDFPVGESISDTIIESIEASKRTILLLSDNFLQSEWCRFEFQTAHHHVLKERSHRLIIVLLHDIVDTKLDPDLSVHLKAGHFLKYKEPWFWEKMYFALPDVTHIVTNMKKENTELEDFENLQN